MFTDALQLTSLALATRAQTCGTPTQRRTAQLAIALFGIGTMPAALAATEEYQDVTAAFSLRWPDHHSILAPATDFAHGAARMVAIGRLAKPLMRLAVSLNSPCASFTSTNVTLTSQMIAATSLPPQVGGRGMKPLPNVTCLVTIQKRTRPKPTFD